MFLQLYILSVTLSLLLCSFLPGQQFIFRADTFVQEKRELLQAGLNQPTFVERIGFDADIPLNRQEYEYLVGITEGSYIDAQQLELAVARIFQKNKFESIQIDITEGALGKLLHFSLVGAWTLAKVKLHGISLGRDAYQQCYLIEKGDLFDQAKHQLSLDKIREKLQSNGYFNGTIIDRVERFIATKSVIVHLDCNQANRFTIKNTKLVVTGYSRQVPLTIQDALYQCVESLQKTLYDKLLFTQATMRMHTLLIENGFFNSEIRLKEDVFRSEQSVSLLWKVVIGDRRALAFLGNTFFSDVQLTKYLLLFGRAMSVVPLTILAQEIENVYRLHGFLDVVVNSYQENDSTVFSIIEGSRAVVDRIVLYNQTHFDHDHLVQACFSELLKGRYAQQSLIQEGSLALIEHYQNDGFLDAVILACRLQLSDLPAYSLEITVDQGERYCVASAQVVDDPEAAIMLANHHCWQSGSFLSSELVANQEAALYDYFNKKGYVQIRLNHEVKRLDKDQAVIVWTARYATKKVQFGKTIIVANEYQPFAYVMKACAFRQGQDWDQEKIRKTFVRLKDLAIFDSILITPAPYQSELGVRDVIVRLAIDDPFELRIRAGLELQQINNYRSFGGLAYLFGSSFIVKNPARAGDSLVFNVELGRFHREFDVVYRYPWPFGYPVRATVEAYSTFYDQPTLFGAAKNVYGLQQHGGLLGLEQDWQQVTVNVTAGVELSVTGAAACAEKNSLQAVQLAHAINFDPLLLGKGILYGFIEPSVFADFLDNKLNPTSGSYTMCSCKCMLPFGRQPQESYLVKFFVEHAQFIPISSFVLALRGRCGHIFERKLKAISPAERFYLGGSHSLRGYDADMVPPLGVFNCEGTEVVVPRGGKSMVNVNVEARIPIWQEIHGVLFIDIGALAGDKWANFMAEGLVGATGFGFRYRTPMGPLRFDMGWKWRRHERLERSYAWFLTFGHSF